MTWSKVYRRKSDTWLNRCKIHEPLWNSETERSETLWRKCRFLKLRTERCMIGWSILTIKCLMTQTQDPRLSTANLWYQQAQETSLSPSLKSLRSSLKSNKLMEEGSSERETPLWKKQQIRAFKNILLLSTYTSSILAF